MSAELLDDECPHGGDPHTCPPCQRAAGRIFDPPKDDDLAVTSRPFRAKYDGTCRGCGLPIYVGQRCVLFGESRIAHEGCAS